MRFAQTLKEFPNKATALDSGGGHGVEILESAIGLTRLAGKCLPCSATL
jgi:hypothetical protein